MRKICELSRRGDINAVAESIKGYYSDMKKHPWHTIYEDIEKYWDKEYPGKDVTDTLMLLRNAVFGAFDVLSLSIALDFPTDELVKIFTNEANWKEGRKKVRDRCIEAVGDLVKKRETRYLIPSGLKRDGIGFLVSGIEDTELESFRRTKPKMKKRSKKKEILELGPLEKTKLGSKFLKEQMVMETQLEKGDPRIPSILEAYDRFLVELEIDITSLIPEPVPTEQITLNGTPIDDLEDRKDAPERKPREKSTQSPLTDFIEEKPARSKKKSKKSSKQRKGRPKKS